MYFMISKLSITWCLIAAAVSFVGMVAVCMALYPKVFQHLDNGVSYFGSVRATFIPYYLGFGLTITCIAVIAARLRRLDRALSAVFWSVVVCMSGVALTSYSLNHTVYALHWAFAIALALCILGACFWLVGRGNLAKLDYLLVGLIVTAIVISALPVVGHIPVVKVYIPRELLIFLCSLWLLGRAALKAASIVHRPLARTN